MNPVPISSPFIRGYSGLSIQRLVAIAYEDDCPPTYLPLHASQSHLRDDEIERFECVFCNHFTLITEGQNVVDELDAQCPSHGVVRAVVYSVMADDFGKLIHVGDTYSEEAAREVLRRLTFETGRYSRCWEISSAHIPKEARQYLDHLADASTPADLFFQAFRVPNSNAVGVKLIATPWTDTNLTMVGGTTAEYLLRQQRNAGVPDPLGHVLHLAALADARFLVFDPDGPVLDGLPLYEEE